MRRDAVVLRAFYRSFNLLDAPDALAKDTDVGARVFAVLLAVAGFGAWQWLYKPVPTEVAPAVPEIATPAPSAEPAPAPVIAAPLPEPVPEPVPRVIEPIVPPAATDAAPPVAATPVERKPAPAGQAAARPVPVRSPREACGERTQFSLYLCMQQQCARTAWTNHPQCVRFRANEQIE